jgi:hypothetical protein
MPVFPHTILTAPAWTARRCPRENVGNAGVLVEFGAVGDEDLAYDYQKRANVMISSQSRMLQTRGKYC